MLAPEIGRAALLDDAWLHDAARRIKFDRQRLDDILSAAGLLIAGGTPLFCLAETSDSPGVVERLGRNGIHVRSFRHRSDQLRFGLPADQTVFARLAAALGHQVPQKVR